MNLVADNISENVRRVTTELQAAALASERAPSTVALIGASKTQNAATIESAYQAGLTQFGENYLQEAQEKLPVLGHLPITWHFFGAIQSNKTRWLAEHFDWVHTVERVKIARRLSSHRTACESAALNVLLQVNIDADPNKAGCTPAAAKTLLEQCLTLPNLRMRGLMTILSKETEPSRGYGAVADLFEQLQPTAQAGHWDTLSMGMSADYPAAIKAGATMIRVGTALFGARRN